MAVKPALDEMDGYVHHFLRTVSFSVSARSTTVPSLRKADVELLELPLPPLAEQQRIVAKLNTLLIRVDACRERLERVGSLIRRFRRSVLGAATSGRLTKDWNSPQIPDGSEPTGALPMGWRSITIETLKADVAHSLAIGPFGSSLKVSDYRTSGVPLVFVREIRAARFGDDRTKFVLEKRLVNSLRTWSVQATC